MRSVLRSGASDRAIVDQQVETPGEDPFHLASYVHALINGLQGGLNPKYKRIVATCKHFAAYGETLPHVVAFGHLC